MIYFDWRVVVRMRVLYVRVDVRHFELNDKWISLDRLIHNSGQVILWCGYELLMCILATHMPNFLKYLVGCKTGLFFDVVKNAWCTY